MNAEDPPLAPAGRPAWLNRTVLGIGLASLLSDWSHEAATSAMPAFLASLGVAAAWIGIIEGVSDALASLAKLTSGHWTDRLARRKPVAFLGYLVTALGTAGFGLAAAAWHILLARSAAWLGRGVRTPIRKAMLAGAATPETYGRAFGFERMMDTVGAVAGPASAFVLLGVLGGDYHRLFFWTLLPGLAAAVCILTLVREQGHRRVSSLSFREGLSRLPAPFRRFALAVGVFGAGDFSHTLLILLATVRLGSVLGPAGAARAAVGLYVMHNVLNAAFAPVAGRLADRADKTALMAGGYAAAALMALVIIVAPPGLGSMAVVFALGGIQRAVNETVEDVVCAQLVPEEQHGTAFGVLAAVNGVGDLVSSVVVGVLWSALGMRAAFGYSLALCAAGALLVGSGFLSRRGRSPGVSGHRAQ